MMWGGAGGSRDRRRWPPWPPHRQEGVGAGQTDVACRDQVHATTDAVPVDGGDHRQRAVGHRGHRGLEPEHLGSGRARPRGHRQRGTVAQAGGTGQAGHGHEVEPHGEMGPAGRHHHGADLGFRTDGRHGPGQIGPERRAEGVALLGPVEPQGGDRAVDLDGQDVRCEGGERWACGRSHGAKRRPVAAEAPGRGLAPPGKRPVAASHPWTRSGPVSQDGRPGRAGSMGTEARRRASLRERSLLCPPSPLNPPDPCPGLPGCRSAAPRRPRPSHTPHSPARRTRCGGTAGSISLTSTASGPPAPTPPPRPRRTGPVPSDRVRSLVTSLGPNAGLMITIDGCWPPWPPPSPRT